MAEGLLIAVGKPKGSKGKPEAEETGGIELEDLAQDLIGAVKRGDAAGVAEAFRAMVLTVEE